MLMIASIVVSGGIKPPLRFYILLELSWHIRYRLALSMRHRIRLCRLLGTYRHPKWC